MAVVVRARPRPGHGGGPGQGAGRWCATRRRTWFPSSGTGTTGPAATRGTRTARRWSSRPTEDRWLEDLEQRNVWQARHGGYQVHHNSVVFAGTWTRDVHPHDVDGGGVRVGAPRRQRHPRPLRLGRSPAVVDRRDETTLDWRFPYGFLDQGYSSPVRMPTPAGDYCYVFDIENREPADTRMLRVLDSQYCQQSLPHPLDTIATFPVPPPVGG